MGGGLMELVAYGAQDVYLTGNPQITFFKVVYRRHTNFSIEAIEQSASGNAEIDDSENEASFTISRNGDLIHKVYLTTNKGTSHGIEHGSKIIKEVEISIGGQMIDRYTQEWQDIWNELTIPKCKAMGFKAMTGNVGLSNRNNSDNDGVGMVQIPLLFWFCRNPGLALPLIALQYHEVKIDFKFNKNTEILHQNKDPNETFEKFKLDLYIDYIYLDTDERRRFAQVSHEYLIEQIQILETNNTNIQDLNINHPVKELIWTSSKAESYENAKLVLNGHDRFEKQREEYFQLRQPYDYHTSIPRPNLPNSATHNISLFSRQSIAGFPTDGLSHIDTTTSGAGEFATLIGNSPSETDNTTSHITGLNNTFDFNTKINDANKFLYYPTFSLRADSNSHPDLFISVEEDTDSDFTTNNVYKYPGFFVNHTLLKDSDHDKLQHIFLPKSIQFLRLAVEQFNIPTTTANPQPENGIHRGSPVLTGNLTYRLGTGNENSTPTVGGPAPFSQMLIRPWTLAAVLHTRPIPEGNRSVRILKLFGLSGNTINLSDNDHIRLSQPEHSSLYDDSLSEFMVLVLPKTITMNEGHRYEFDVESLPYTSGGTTISPIKTQITATVVKKIDGSDIASVLVSTDAERNLAFGGSDYMSDANNATTTGSNLNQRGDIFGNNIIDSGVTKDTRFKARKANGIVLAGTTANSINEVQFIYLDHNINPVLSNIIGHDYKTYNLSTANQRIDPASDTTEFANLPKFKINNISTLLEKHTQKSASNTSNFSRKINVYSFALKPEEHQPSGTCNFSRIDTAQLITDNKIGSGQNIYAVNYNVLRIMSGMGGLAYSN